MYFSDLPVRPGSAEELLPGVPRLWPGARAPRGLLRRLGRVQR